jgi:hypothetical protein
MALGFKNKQRNSFIGPCRLNMFDNISFTIPEGAEYKIWPKKCSQIFSASLELYRAEISVS